MKFTSVNTCLPTRAEIVDAHGEWCKQFSWDWFATFTLKSSTNAWGAQRTFQSYLTRLSAAAQTQVSSVFTVERGPIGGQFHIHALVGSVGALPPRCASPTATACRTGCGTHAWKAGFCEIRRYDSDLAGRFYLFKGLGRTSEMQIVGEPKRDVPADIVTEVA